MRLFKITPLFEPLEEVLYLLQIGSNFIKVTKCWLLFYLEIQHLAVFSSNLIKYIHLTTSKSETSEVPQWLVLLCRRLHSAVLEEKKYSRDAKDITLGRVALLLTQLGLALPKGQKTSDRKFFLSLNTPKSQRNILHNSALASKKWSNQKIYYAN